MDYMKKETIQERQDMRNGDKVHGNENKTLKNRKKSKK